MSNNSSPFERLSRSEAWHPNRTLNKWVQGAVMAVFGVFALISILTTFGIVLTLVVDAIPFFAEVSLKEFLTSTNWTPLFLEPRFGIFVLVSATFLTSAIAIATAVPLGLLSAICLSEYAPRSVRRWLKPALEILAGVPTVVYGYFALLFVTPLLSKLSLPLPLVKIPT